MQRKDIKSTLEKVRSGKFSTEEEQTAEYWLHQLNQEQETEYNQENLERVSAEMWASIQTRRQPAEKPAIWRLNKGLLVAAAIAVIISAIGILFFTSKQKPEIATGTYANDVDPGKQGATLTLANGKKIRLSEAANGELAKQSGVTVTKTQDGQLIYEIKEADQEKNNINTLSTSNGETYKLKLPDGSLVWLNSASSITYNASLIQNGKRNVKLSGEGYFEIAKDKQHPFIVETKNQEVEVLGTHFNINSYPDEPAITTTLVEGSVQIATENHKQTIKPGQQASLNGEQIKVGEVDTEAITAWKDDDFNFNRVEFKTAMRKIARWYDVEIIYDDQLPTDIETGGWISRKQKLSAVLKFIESSGLVHFKIEGKKIYVSK